MRSDKKINYYEMINYPDRYKITENCFKYILNNLEAKAFDTFIFNYFCLLISQESAIPRYLSKYLKVISPAYANLLYEKFNDNNHVKSESLLLSFFLDYERKELSKSTGSVKKDRADNSRL